VEVTTNFIHFFISSIVAFLAFSLGFIAKRTSGLAERRDQITLMAAVEYRDKEQPNQKLGRTFLLTAQPLLEELYYELAFFCRESR
jgi:hypothetical protein